ncbi:hypothetical protein ACFWD7_57265 [Streptomyces mirabilis]|uniref:hypothetical protein n=1 Tax=Streptomyces mirabilis TaxID=68239 RepID=UPI0036A2A3EB
MPTHAEKAVRNATAMEVAYGLVGERIGKITSDHAPVRHGERIPGRLTVKLASDPDNIIKIGERFTNIASGSTSSYIRPEEERVLTRVGIGTIQTPHGKKVASGYALTSPDAVDRNAIAMKIAYGHAETASGRQFGNIVSGHAPLPSGRRIPDGMVVKLTGDETLVNVGRRFSDLKNPASGRWMTPAEEEVLRRARIEIVEVSPGKKRIAPNREGTQDAAPGPAMARSTGSSNPYGSGSVPLPAAPGQAHLTDPARSAAALMHPVAQQPGDSERAWAKSMAGNSEFGQKLAEYRSVSLQYLQSQPGNTFHQEVAYAPPERWVQQQSVNLLKGWRAYGGATAADRQGGPPDQYQQQASSSGYNR